MNCFHCLVIENEPRLVCEGFLGLFTSGADDKIRDVDALAPGGDFDESLLAGSGAELEAPVSWLFGG